MALKEKDQKNLENFLAFLETNKMRGELRGSAAAGKSDYNDLDLNVWDAEEKGPGYFFGKGAINKFLNKIGAENINYRCFFSATWCEGLWAFDFNGTKFDISYTPSGPRFVGYKIEKFTDKKPKK